jgi:rubredoxin
MRFAHCFAVAGQAGIFSPGSLLNILSSLKLERIPSVRLGLRQQLLIDVPARSLESMHQQLSALKCDFSPSKVNRPGLISSYSTSGLFLPEQWLRQSVYKDVFDQFERTPDVQVNVMDGQQTFLPVLSGNINWVSSQHPHYWHLALNWPASNDVYRHESLVYTNDIGRVTAAIAGEMKNGNLPAVHDLLRSLISASSLPASSLQMTRRELPQFEGFHFNGSSYWLGIYSRNEQFNVDALMELCTLCLQTGTSEIYVTQWKTLLVRNIESKHHHQWLSLLNRHRINVEHAANELHWQVDDHSEDGLWIKQAVTKQFATKDIRTGGLSFSVQTIRVSEACGAVIVRKQFAMVRNQLRPLDKYDIYFRKDFNINSEAIELYRANVEREHIGTYLLGICKTYLETISIDEQKPVPETRNAITENKKVVHQCGDCLFIYDSAYGDPLSGIGAGVAFDKLPEDYRCSTCDAERSAFIDLPVPATSHQDLREN